VVLGWAPPARLEGGGGGSLAAFLHFHLQGLLGASVLGSWADASIKASFPPTLSPRIALFVYSFTFGDVRASPNIIPRPVATFLNFFRQWEVKCYADAEADTPWLKAWAPNRRAPFSLDTSGSGFSIQAAR